jgi:hypothetical protein
VRYRESEIDIAIFNEHMNKDVSGWVFRGKEDWGKYLKACPFVMVP